jgi:hypothetical protein
MASAKQDKELEPLSRTVDASEQRYYAGSKYHRDKYRSYHKAVHKQTSLREAWGSIP